MFQTKWYFFGNTILNINQKKKLYYKKLHIFTSWSLFIAPTYVTFLEGKKK